MPSHRPPSESGHHAQEKRGASLTPFGILILVLVLMILSRGKPNQFEPGAQIKPVPVMALSSGKIKNLAQLTQGDEPVALHFFATWCSSCMREWDGLPTVSRQHGAGFKVLLIGVDTPLSLKNLIAQRPTTLPVFVGGAEIEQAARIRSFPYTVFVTPALEVLFDYPGALSASGFDQARSALQNVARGKAGQP